MLKCATSLWSADLANLEAEIRRVEPFSETFHLDVADGHYTPTMLFFPDLVGALRKHTRRPFEVHLMTVDPLAWIDPFVAAGADTIIFCHDAVKDPVAVLKAIHARGKRAGLSLLITEKLELIEQCWHELDLLVIVGTAMGIKGASLDESVPAKIAQARRIIAEKGCKTEIEADGGIRRETVPLLAAAGTDWIVPGSLMFKEEPAEMRAWLRTLTP
jgi:ribulose-phosphate 3-epimerase